VVSAFERWSRLQPIPKSAEAITVPIIWLLRLPPTHGVQPWGSPAATCGVFTSCCVAARAPQPWH